MPDYQASSGAPGVINSYSSGAPCAGQYPSNPPQYCREVPDVSASGSTEAGYVIYYTRPATVRNGQDGWCPVGGTSTSTPIWAGSSRSRTRATRTAARRPRRSASSTRCSTRSPPGRARPTPSTTSRPATTTRSTADRHLPGDRRLRHGDRPRHADRHRRLLARARRADVPGEVRTATKAPTVSGLSVAGDPVSTPEAPVGGTVTVDGSGFTSFSVVRFGSVAATSSFISSTQLSATVPPGSGAVDVTVSDFAGTSANEQRRRLHLRAERDDQPARAGRRLHPGSVGDRSLRLRLSTAGARAAAPRSPTARASTPPCSASTSLRLRPSTPTATTSRPPAHTRSSPRRRSRSAVRLPARPTRRARC